MWRLVRCGLHPPPRSPVRTDVSRSLTNSPQFAGISAVQIPAVRSLRRMKTACRRFGAFRLWRLKSVSRRAGKARPETRFACDRDRFACKNFERIWEELGHGGHAIVDALAKVR